MRTLVRGAVSDFSSTQLTWSGGDAGGAPGVSAVAFWDARTEDYLVVMANMDMPIAETIGEALFRSEAFAALGRDP